MQGISEEGMDEEDMGQGGGMGWQGREIIENGTWREGLWGASREG